MATETGSTNISDTITNRTEMPTAILGYMTT